MIRSDRARLPAGVFAGGICLLAATLAAVPALAGSCPETKQSVRFGFYAYFEPVSHSAAREPGAAGFDEHRGYEADLLTALEAMKGINLSLLRRGVTAWEGIWLLPSGPDYDMTGGGITALESRTHDAAGTRAIAFTASHIQFRQSLLVRTEDAKRLTRYEKLDNAVRVGVIAATTGESRLLEMVGLVDTNGFLAAGVRIDTPRGVVIADGSPSFRITAAGAGPALDGRQRLYPPSPGMPQVVYMANEEALIRALLAGEIDAFAQAEIGNRQAARAYGDRLVIGTVEEGTEAGGFAVAASDTALAACVNEAIGWLTDGGRIGYRDWFDDPGIFLHRARLWNGGLR
ncbi:MAG: transporter substrate-binding domain-containing protein [Alphaproteobacteria bacterium]|nr:transporter substrate-binding domain-containing protein [Alphaproteobacteria bacterium]